MSFSYRAPQRDFHFVHQELLGENGFDVRRDAAALEPDLEQAVLDEAGRFCEAVLHPLNRVGDEEGCRFDQGQVTTPPGFRDAYRQFCEAGWPGYAAAEAHGGQSVPRRLGSTILEMLCTSNLSFSIYPGLTQGAYNALDTHADDWLKSVVLPRFVEGAWSGTMCLTEPHCGTDLSLIRTRAVEGDAGRFAVSGTKIFISAGEHDLTENIVHLVLARLPDAPAGIRGISLFAVSKYRLGEDGSLGERNGVECAGIESKMGIHGASTCTMEFDAADAHLVGERHRGMRAMFTMMNAARLAVGVQGLGLAELAYQGAVAYAKERRQGQAADGSREPPVPIVFHPDVKHMLLTMRALIEGGRGLVGWVSTLLDLAETHPDPVRRSDASATASFLIPVVKGFLSDIGSRCANLGVQVYGGHGYIRGNGMEQIVRDARICEIYEGTNGVQALDLVGRKLAEGAGRNLRGFFHPVAAYLDTRKRKPELDEFVKPLARSFGRLQQATGKLAAVGLRAPANAAAVASDYARLVGLVSLGFVWARAAEVSLGGLGRDDDEAFYRAKVQTARFYFNRVLPEADGCYASVARGGAETTAFDPDWF